MSKHKNFKRALKSNPHFAAQEKRQAEAHIREMNTRQLEKDMGLRPLSEKEQAVEDAARKACPQLFALMDMLNMDSLF
jgi:hypothetical protein